MQKGTQWRHPLFSQCRAKRPDAQKSALRWWFQLLKQQYSRYTPEMVEQDLPAYPGTNFSRAADLFTSVRKDGDMKKAATIIYAVGWTQHTFGTQIIRTAAMLPQLLMPEMSGVPVAVRERAAWSFEYSGRHGHGRALRCRIPRAPENACSRRTPIWRYDVSEARHTDRVEACTMGFDELLLEHSEILHFVP